MKKILAMCACAVSLFSAQSIFAEGECCDNQFQPSCEQQTGNCICQYVQYVPCPYYERSCTYETIPCPRTCTRCVPEYFQVQRVKYVPEYYNTTHCRYRTECYTINDYRTVAKPICIPRCKYYPRYFWKAQCQPTCTAAPASCG